jgi:soluble lytic murein transglycosylase-like protein
MIRLCAEVLLGLAISVSAAGVTSPECGHAETVYYADAYAAYYRIPKELVHAIITQESGWDPRAISPKGAMGLMQLMPATAAEYGVQDPFGISENLSGGVRYLADLMQQFNGDCRLVLAAYYRGSRPILRGGLHYSGADVLAYVSSVRRLYLEELTLHNPSPNLAYGGNQ